MKLPPKTARQFQKTVYDYYRTHKRTFPWRQTRDPYAILVSEVMLQQTQAERVVPFYNRWMKAFPTVKELARASVKNVLRAWSGLGYNRRALYLKRTAEVIVKEYDGKIPRDAGKLRALPGIGPYTAGAITAFAFGIPSVFIETNIRTVYLHFFFKGRKKIRDEEILELIEKTLPIKVQPLSRFEVEPLPSKVRPFSRSKVEPCSVREWYHALMDYGAMLKKTNGNPNTRSAHYAKQSRFKGSRRELRGEILRQVARKQSITPNEFSWRKDLSVSDVMAELVSEGFLRKEGRVFKHQ